MDVLLLDYNGVVVNDGALRAEIALDLARAHLAGCVMLATTHPSGALAAADRVWGSFDGHDPAELEPLFGTLGAAVRV